ncbi:mediator of RNA polymerase II transcription subunit 16-like isoform X1 [Hibiscus syriacus]|uniref:Mediator of RNA polymerase II transcription subunit 16-like isoform X1 n=1 Tax=Hibiscus syriacus TaxID=106335 RepID=A0A6A3C2B3_HIBSY|nr:stem-specific protein TSJT1-like isoform X1 [Hibiscus syriacus]XP_039061727.1 stem-specific protein TSJT1-like isoform X1 [Hibiscus syriacus]XP_039061728.1 stem-specific protein TSJT1-like isoform X1 [Hibiscus syriacus]KAE8723036.1 mediator of RNA polymerase II transcription subunit 16-like isoform X1 [Hibiscus syriacus]
MLTIFNKELMNPPKELHSPASLSSSNKPKSPEEIIKDFLASNPTNAFSIGFGSSACFAYAPPENRYSNYQRLFCGVDEIYCIFLGGLNNLNSLLRQYGLSKGNNEAMFIIEAYRTLRDRGPYPADQVLKDLEGSYGFVVYDGKAKSVFAALGSDERVKFHWGVAADGSVVVSDNLKLIKESCSKSFAPFPAGCMFHSEQGLMSFEHPRSKMKAMPRIDSEGVMCGADFKADVQSRICTMPRVGSEANWALRGFQA